MTRATRKRALRLAEATFWIAGLALLSFTVAVRATGELERREAIRSFEAQPDQTLWSEGRKRAWAASLDPDAPGPVALLSIPSLDLKVPVFDGDDEVSLNRGVGRIPGTAQPGDAGNLGLAGHRDGYFRVLKDIALGDRIALQGVERTTRYHVDEIQVVDPEDVEVLDRGDVDSITLVTCHPFYYVGHAPQRFIVRGVLEDPTREPSEKNP